MDGFITSLFSQGGEHAVVGTLLLALIFIGRAYLAAQKALLDEKDKQLAGAGATFEAVTSALATVKSAIDYVTQQPHPTPRRRG